jgi:sec-independent protein translocase protein TatA
LRIFKSEVSQMQNESNAPSNGSSAQQPAPQLPAAQQPTPSATEPRTEQKSV